VESFDAFYVRYREPVLAYFARRVGEPEIAADLMAETFARALVQWRKRPPDSPLDDHDIERIGEIADATDLARLLEDALSVDEYEALRARVVDEEPYAELARRLRCSEAVARKRVSRAIARARTMIGEGDA
jgi:DNA-directed RNA polymerase specialized sigma24 family protein